MKKRGKKLMAFIGSVLMIGMCVLPVDAMDNKTDISNQKQMDCVFEYPVNETPILQKASAGETLEYKYADGTITQEYLDFSTLTSLYGTR